MPKKIYAMMNRYLRKNFTQEYLNLTLDSDQLEKNMRERLQTVWLAGYEAGKKSRDKM